MYASLPPPRFSCAPQAAYNSENLRHAVNFGNEVPPGTPSLFDVNMNPSKPVSGRRDMGGQRERERLRK